MILKKKMSAKIVCACFVISGVFYTGLHLEEIPYSFNVQQSFNPLPQIETTIPTEAKLQDSTSAMPPGYYNSFTHENNTDSVNPSFAEVDDSKQPLTTSLQQDISTAIEPEPIPAANSGAAAEPAMGLFIAGAIRNKAKKPIAAGDLFQVVYMLIKKLNAEEIRFLFGFYDDKYTQEELNEARKLLFTKLSPEEVEKLRDLNLKYEAELQIFKEDVQSQQ